MIEEIQSKTIQGTSEEQFRRYDKTHYSEKVLSNVPLESLELITNQRIL